MDAQESLNSQNNPKKQTNKLQSWGIYKPMEQSREFRNKHFHMRAVRKASSHVIWNIKAFVIEFFFSTALAYGLIFVKGAKTVQWGKDSLRWGWEKISTCKLMNWALYLIPYAKLTQNGLNCIKDTENKNHRYF